MSTWPRGYRPPIPGPQSDARANPCIPSAARPNEERRKAVSITPIPDELRTAVIELHGSECLRCGVQCTWSGPTKLHIDHVIPEIHGGPTTLANLQVLCRDCNLNKGADTADYRTTKARAKLARQ